MRICWCGIGEEAVLLELTVTGPYAIGWSQSRQIRATRGQDEAAKTERIGLKLERTELTTFLGFGNEASSRKVVPIKSLT
jgi:hypothetical protein